MEQYSESCNNTIQDIQKYIDCCDKYFPTENFVPSTTTNLLIIGIHVFIADQMDCYFKTIFKIKLKDLVGDNILCFILGNKNQLFANSDMNKLKDMEKIFSIKYTKSKLVNQERQYKTSLDIFKEFMASRNNYTHTHNEDKPASVDNEDKPASVHVRLSFYDIKKNLAYYYQLIKDVDLANPKK